MDDETLKVAVNTFVWQHADGSLTLDEAEAIAVKIFFLLRPNDSLNPER